MGSRHRLAVAQNGFDQVVIKASDIMVIALALKSIIPCHLYQRRGTKTRTHEKTINVCPTLGEEVCRTLLGLYA